MQRNIHAHRDSLPGVEFTALRTLAVRRAYTHTHTGLHTHGEREGIEERGRREGREKREKEMKKKCEREGREERERKQRDKTER